MTEFDIASFEEGVEVSQGDLTDAKWLEQGAKIVDVILHAGTVGDVYLAGSQPSLAAEVNVAGAANIVEAANRHGARITIQTNGSQGSQSTHAQDIARAFEPAAKSSFIGEAFNIIAQEATTVMELIESIVEQYTTNITFSEPRPADAPPVLESSARPWRIVGWMAETSFGEGLDELISSVPE